MLRLNSIKKSFPGVCVLNGVSIDIEPGDFIAIQGGNGSGKTTLLNIAAGHLTANSGSIMLDGKVVEQPQPATMLRLGIVLIAQMPQIFPGMSIYEHLAMRAIPVYRKRNLVKAAINRGIDELRTLLGDKQFKASTSTDSLTEEQRQLLEFSAIAMFPVRYVFIDETTSALDSKRAKLVLGHAKHLADNGVGVVFVTHRGKEVQEWSKKSYKLENGVLETLNSSNDTTPHSDTVSRQRSSRPAILKLNKATPVKNGKSVTTPINNGEIVGFTGALGTGYEGLGRILVGLSAPYSGTVQTLNPKLDLMLGKNVAYLSRARGVGNDFFYQTVLFNVTLNRQSSIFASPNKISAVASDRIHSYEISAPSLQSPIEHLSGGNRVKAAVARVLEQDACLIVLDEPFTGVDADARSVIKSRVRAKSTPSRAIVLISREAEDLYSCCDRVETFSHA